MADDNWTYSVDDVGGDEVSDTSNDPDPPSESDDGIDLNKIVFFPFTVLSAYAIVEYSVVLSAFETLFGAGGVATALTTSFAVIGGISLVMFTFVGGVGVTLLLAGVYYREAPLVAVGLLLSILIAGGVAGGHLIFTGVPLFVGTVLTFGVIVYSMIALKQMFQVLAGFTLP